MGKTGFITLLAFIALSFLGIAGCFSARNHSGGNMFCCIGNSSDCCFIVAIVCMANKWVGYFLFSVRGLVLHSDDNGKCFFR